MNMLKNNHEIPLSKSEFLEKLKNDREFNEKYGNKGIDQIKNLIFELKNNPDSRRLMVNAWNVSELSKMVLPPCHYGFQVYTKKLSYNDRLKLYNENIENHSNLTEIELDNLNVPNRSISLMWTQRSVDVGLGLPFNITSYALLLIMIAKEVNMVPDELKCSLGDCHIYKNHIDGLSTQITRPPFKLPEIILKNKIVNDISEYTIDDFILKNYDYHPTIKLGLSN